MDGFTQIGTVSPTQKPFTRPLGCAADEAEDHVCRPALPKPGLFLRGVCSPPPTLAQQDSRQGSAQRGSRVSAPPARGAAQGGCPGRGSRWAHACPPPRGSPGPAPHAPAGPAAPSPHFPTTRKLVFVPLNFSLFICVCLVFSSRRNGARACALTQFYGG